MRSPPMIPMVETATRPKPGPRDGGAIFDWSVTIDGLHGDILFWAGSYWQDRKDRPVATAPFFRGNPRLTPRPQTNYVPTVQPGAVAGYPAPALSYQWLIDGVPFPGAIGASFGTINADGTKDAQFAALRPGQELSCRVTATNASGSAVAIASDFVKPAQTVADPAPYAGAKETPP